MNLKSRLKELAVKSDHLVELAAKGKKCPECKPGKPCAKCGPKGKKELGFFLSNKPQYDGPNGQFSGMHNEVNPVGVGAAGVGAAGAVAGGAVAHNAILDKFGARADDGFGNLIRATNPGSTAAAYKGAANAGLDAARKGVAGVTADSKILRKGGLGVNRWLKGLKFAGQAAAEAI